MIRAWHGTLSPDGRFDSFDARPGFTSFSTEPDGGRIYALQALSGWTSDSRLFGVQLDVTRPLDYRIRAHVPLVLNYLEQIDFKHYPRADWKYWIEQRGAYQCLEHEDLLEQHGFDAVFTSESGWVNIHLLDVSLIKVIRVHDDDPGDFGMLGDGRCRAGWDPYA